MSFILDALHKSETERQQSATPGLADTRYQSRRRRGHSWVPWLIIVLAANALLLLIVLLNRSTDADTATIAVSIDTPENRSPARVAPSLTTIQTEPDTRRPLVEEAAVAATVEPAAPPAGTADQAPAATAREQRVSNDPPAAEEQTSVPSLEQLRLAGLVSLPTLHLDIHVFSQEPSQRFVFVNMAKYREGEQLKEGPRIDEINEAGVVLTHQGNQFLLTRE
jgi:general secretion pathway protein B